MKRKEPSLSQLVIPLMSAGVAFGLWQHSLFAGMFIMAVMVFYSNHNLH